MDIHNISSYEERKKPQLSIKWWMNKQNVVHQYNGRVVSRNKEWSADTGYNTDEPWNMMPHRRSQWEKVTNTVIPFIWNVQKWQVQK